MAPSATRPLSPLWTAGSVATARARAQARVRARAQAPRPTHARRSAQWGCATTSLTLAKRSALIAPRASSFRGHQILAQVTRRPRRRRRRRRCRRRRAPVRWDQETPARVTLHPRLVPVRSALGKSAQAQGMSAQAQVRSALARLVRAPVRLAQGMSAQGMSAQGMPVLVTLHPSSLRRLHPHRHRLCSL